MSWYHILSAINSFFQIYNSRYACARASPHKLREETHCNPHHIILIIIKGYLNNELTMELSMKPQGNIFMTEYVCSEYPFGGTRQCTSFRQGEKFHPVPKVFCG